MTDKQKQHLLGYLGYYTGIPDGIWGRLSREATLAFQAGYGLEQDGVFGPETEKRILEVIASGEPPAEREPEDAPDWWQEIRYFTRAEFRCPCGACGGFPAEPAESLARLADRVRELRAGIGGAMNDFLAPLYQGPAFEPGSTDVGDVSWQCPTGQIHVAAWPNRRPRP